MKKTYVSIILLALLGVLAVPTVRAEETAKEKKYSKKTLEKYDTDKDGKLSPDEIAAMKADKEKIKAEKKAKKEATEKGGAEK